VRPLPSLSPSRSRGPSLTDRRRATGPNSVFIRVLLDKKYALPYKVVDALVFHFLRFKRDTRQMPVLWHQSFLVFVQRCVPALSLLLFLARHERRARR